MLEKIKEKLRQFLVWCKEQWRRIIVVIIGGSVVFAAGTDLTKNEVSPEKLATKYEASQEIKAKYQMDSSSLVKTDVKNAELDAYKGEPKDEVKITLGDRDKSVFVPNIELKRWNEVSFKIKTDELLKDVATKDKDLKLETDKIKFDSPKISFEMYDYTEGEGGYKFIWYLNEKPATNKVKFQIESSGLDFFYQPPLTEEYQNGYSKEFQKEIVVSETQVKDLDGNVLVERPENVVGSYAVYHSTKGGMNDAYGKNYKTGQAFFIYRPHIIDASGVETWGILHIENGIYSVEIPQEFLDKAVYPIKSNDTFGYTSVGGTGVTWSSDWVNGYLTTPSGAGNVTLISVAGYKVSNDFGVICGLYKSSDMSILSPQSNTSTINDTSGKFYDLSITGTLSITIQEYMISWLIDGVAANNQKMNATYIGGVMGKHKTATYPTFPSPLSGTTDTGYKYSIYATYTPSGGGTTPPTRNRVMIISENNIQTNNS